MPITSSLRVSLLAGLSLALALTAPPLAAQDAASAAPAAPSEIKGLVFNDTGNKPVAGVKVEVMALGPGLPVIASATTNAQGAFDARIPASMSASAASGMQLRAIYQQATYIRPLQPGQDTARFDVYDRSGNVSDLQVKAEIAVLQPEQGQLAVVDDYVVENNTHPAKTVYAPGGLFRFRLPQGVSPDGANVIGPGGIPTREEPQPAGGNIYRLNYAFRPGESRLQIAYRLPYAQLKAALTEQPLLPVQDLSIYVPPPMKLQSKQLAPAGQDQGYDVYSMQSPRGAIRFTVSGNAPLPQAMQAAADGAAGDGASDNGASAANGHLDNPSASGAAMRIAQPTYVEKHWQMILLLLAVIALFGFMYFGFVPGAPLAADAAPLPAASPDAARRAAKGGKQPGNRSARNGGAAAPSSASPSDSSVAAQLATLKDDLFLLEVRRQSGRISDEDYASARAALEERMRGLNL